VADRTREHRVTVEGLKPGRTYSYRVVSQDATGRIRTWPAAGKPPATFTTLAADRRAPTLRGLRVSSLPDGTATITWSTDEPSASTVWFGTSRTRLDHRRVDGTSTRAHRVVLTGLEPGRVYWLRADSSDRSGNRASTGPAVRFSTVGSGVANQTAGQFRTGRSTGRLFVSSAGSGALTLRGPGSGTHTSAVIDSQQKVAWRRAVVVAKAPPGSQVAVFVRTGNTARPDGTWSAWKRATGPLGLSGRYLQYRVELSASTAAVPSVSGVGFTNTGTRHTESELPSAADRAVDPRRVWSAIMSAIP
jgi:hypothetical protein